MGNVAESDWRLFRERLPRWQESYMEKLIGEYMEMLGGEGPASEKFWALEKRVSEDKRRSGVLIERMSRSTMHREIALLARDGAIAPRDLEGFTEDVRRLAQSYFQ